MLCKTSAGVLVKKKLANQSPCFFDSSKDPLCRLQKPHHTVASEASPERSHVGAGAPSQPRPCVAASSPPTRATTSIASTAADERPRLPWHCASRDGGAGAIGACLGLGPASCSPTPPLCPARELLPAASELCDGARSHRLCEGEVHHARFCRLCSREVCHVMALSNLLGISILYCFEWLTSLKINFHKSEVFVFGGSQQERENLANMLNCSLSSLPKSEGVLFIS